MREGVPRRRGGRVDAADVIGRNEIQEQPTSDGQAKHFVVPTYNIWTITDDYWNEPAA